MEKKKITFIIPDLQNGGAERVLTILANHLVKYYDVQIIVFFKGSPFYRVNSKVKINYCTEDFVRNKTFFHSIYHHLILFKNVFCYSKKHRSDVIIGFMTTPNLFAIIISKLLRIPSIISERIHPKYSDISNLMFKLRIFLYPFSSLLIIQTKEILNYFSKFMRENSLLIIKNPISNELSVLKNKSISKELVILNIGRLDNQKNQDLLIKAFASINHEGWKLIIIGEGKNRGNYERLIKSLGLEDKILLLGKVDNVADYYNRASIFAFSSRYEGFPNALMEALYFELPCIATDCPSGPSELIINNFNGFLIPVGDQNRMEICLDKLINSKVLRDKFSINSSFQCNLLKEEIIINQWRSAIESLLNNPSKNDKVGN
ncbi:GalNAc-alpha-(1-_4)-GalNAc-alpha-(1-_3)-diNAcBac-PP-undecaprenol alpha-1,4-N-acetyl-D-galactosaminyltransferase [Gelidibacter sediminis]|uniref:GalNAc-alpha-(1->4)-GalNAc-alpha-(1->3)-diNAcBac-PP-undecaprenol alpha-1,4-N-acetyl-D-galactosaminyltransferase n=1 Tax=Gelidibacter sediminis TaxID=1608710 RepID=A0A4R7PYE2_9FLAO|nr:glycosyltransferase family 4 protein [Gelidibacter sediminis]TDU40014.1 GalNAc-alpha-(1->4)-GalNAc-alpha-(1->3)-diNAcBac-PP-undecaprenol alpha-1,4-N-acetyl-D-galactosaminyltransferase [Gelidibacter sediminis]